MPDSAARYDVFLSHNGADKPAVEEVARRLLAAGIRPFLDTWHLIPGQPWQEELEQALADSASTAVFLGPSGVSPWHNEEMRSALDDAVRRRDDYRIIPVLLPGAAPESASRFLARRSWVDFRAGLDDAEAFGRLIAGIQGHAIDIGPYQLTDEPAPYRGLMRFEAEHARFFFGRDADTKRLIEKLDRHTFVAVVGASGSGKSSLVRAGLLPALAASALPESKRWRVLTFTPGSQPLEALAAQIATFLPMVDRPLAVKKVMARLKKDPSALRSTLHAYLADDPHPVLLSVDQFEELFTLCVEGPEKCRSQTEQFIALLADAAAHGDRQIRIVITLRADFLGRCLAFPALRSLLEDRQLLLGPLTPADLREAIVRPAQQVGAFLEKGLVNTILADVGDEPGVLPLLQHALYELWLARRGPWLTLDAYEASGGVRGALQRRAQAVYDSLTQEQKAIARNIFLRLTALGEGANETRRRANQDELYPAAADAGQVNTVLQLLSGPQARLVVAEAGSVEVAHEALIRGWPLLQGWLEADREGLRIHRQLTEAADEWKRSSRNNSYLYQGVRLATASEWAKGHPDSLNPMERTFLRTSQRMAWMVRGITLGAVMLPTAVIAAVIILAATGQWNRLLYRPLPTTWVGIPASTFTMGSTEQEIENANSVFARPEYSYNLTNEVPTHTVYLDTYQINRYEVTNRQYLQCVRATVCNPPGNTAYDQPGFADDPVTDVNWGEALAFCKWAGGSLPTEAQWEKAARGSSSPPPQFPWGDGPEPTRANVGGTTVRPVGSYSPGGDSPYGVADMAGNVWEWVQDWYASDTYVQPGEGAIRNPTGPATGEKRVLRGGSFDNAWMLARSAFRTELRPGGSDRDVGFRCVQPMRH